jgi:hypothetical protein
MLLFGLALKEEIRIMSLAGNKMRKHECMYSDAGIALQ